MKVAYSNQIRLMERGQLLQQWLIQAEMPRAAETVSEMIQSINDLLRHPFESSDGNEFGWCVRCGSAFGNAWHSREAN